MTGWLAAVWTWLRVVLPPMWVIVLLAIVYGLINAVHYGSGLFGLRSNPDQFHGLCIVLITNAALAYGVFRAIVFNPFWRLAYREWLLKDSTRAIASMGYIPEQGEQMRVLENTGDTHNLVVCTLCSCYPWAVLGLPPVWYKSAPYRSQAVADPRGVLQQFGTELPEDVEGRVWDSTSEMRYLVLPQRPEGTDGWTDEQLAELVTRNSMIGVEKAQMPELAR